MLSFLLAVHFVLALAIIGLVLLQKHDSDGALGSSGGGAASGMFSVRGQANLLTRSTAVLMALFIINCLIMAKIAKRVPAKESIIDIVAQESVPVEMPREEKSAPASVPPVSPTPSTPPATPAKKK
ncbi:MAG: preprotein translocase subunit SecG [Holosporaceae bacterium]|jgi:preprotein translocase subunit SecG|nr:preprotein translocase subunit SecG [Holosporaceae bacterium]